MSIDVRAKLAEKGLTLPVAAKPVAAYVPATRTGNIVFTAGQLPLVNGAIPDTGKVGAEITQERAKELAQICALNCLAAVELVAPLVMRGHSTVLGHWRQYLGAVVKLLDGRGEAVVGIVELLLLHLLLLREHLANREADGE
jgi:hypothetical protein